MKRGLKYLGLGMVLLLVLIPLWAYAVYELLGPFPHDLSETAVNRLIALMVGVPIILVTSVLAWRWQAGAAKPMLSQATEVASQSSVTVDPALEAQARREYVLEVVSLGITLDKYRQGTLWDQLKRGHPYASIREQDPKKYPWSATEKEWLEGGRTGDTLENGAKYLPAFWPMPSFCAESSVAKDPKDPTSEKDPPGGIVGGAISSGLGWTLFVSAGWMEEERPDRLVEKAFAFFDEHPDVPYIVLSSSDGLYLRNKFAPKGTAPLIRDGHYVPEMPDSSVLMVLVRRERVDALRPFVFKDADEVKLSVDALEREGFAWRLGMAFKELQRNVPKPEGRVLRDPTVQEWLAEAEHFTDREDIYPSTISLLRAHRGPPKGYKPTPWFPLPWNDVQVKEFDRLPSLGYLHRPVFVKMVDEEGKPLKRKDQRAKVLARGWEDALQTLPEAQRQASPARVITATGGNTDTTVLLHGLLDQWAKQGGPELDSTKPDQWVNTDDRLGNTGAATWFMQMGIGVMASYREGGISAAINFRDPDEASIVFVSPPSEEKRKTQQHPKGGDVLRHHATPAINPANYQ